MHLKLRGEQGELHVVDSGRDGPAALFIHSSAGNATHWASQMEALCSRYRVVAVDLRGHGESDSPLNGDYSVEALSADVGRVIAELELAPCVLVGHSMGGIVALNYAAHHPEAVTCLFLLDPGNDARHLSGEQKQALVRAMRENYQETSEGYWQTLIGSDEGVRPRLMNDLHAASPEAMRGEMQAMFDYDPLPALDDFKNPVFCLVAKSTQSPSSLHVLRPELPHEVIADAGHWLQLSRPARVTQAIQNFLAELVDDPKEEG